MHSTILSKYVTAALACAAVMLGLPDSARAAPKSPYGTGTLAKGKLSHTLFRGAAVTYELAVIQTPNNCQGEVDMQISWNEAENWVKVRLRSEPNTLEPFPDVERTLGVDYFPNPLFFEPEDFDDGRYQLWIVGTAGPLLPFYYSLDTLDLLGSVADFEEPPLAIPVPFPTLYMFASPMFQPSADGRVKLDWEFPYDGAVRGDRPEFAHHIVTFPPPNLCFANQHRIDQSWLRPYISDPFPAAEARPFSDYLRGGLVFDITVEPGQYATEPPLSVLVGTYSGSTALGGTVPRGWQVDLDAVFMGLAPPIKPFAGHGSCEQYVEPHPGAGIPFCLGP